MTTKFGLYFMVVFVAVACGFALFLLLSVEMDKMFFQACIAVLVVAGIFAVPYGFVWLLVWANAGPSGRKMQQKFQALGNLRGKSKDEIMVAVGPPSSVSSLPQGKELLQWMRGGYHIAVVFNRGDCEGISHEARVSP